MSRPSQDAKAPTSPASPAPKAPADKYVYQRSKAGQLFDEYMSYFCKILTPPLLSISVFLFVSPFGPWRAYFVVPATLFLLILWTIHACRTLWSTEWFRRFLTWPKRLLRGTLIPFLLQIKGRIHQSVIGNILMWTASLNLYFPLNWVYYNVNLREVVNKFIDVGWSFVVYFFSPTIVLKEFEDLLKSIRVFTALEKIKTTYVDSITAGIIRGEVWPLVISIIASILLILAALGFYLGWYGDDKNPGLYTMIKAMFKHDVDPEIVEKAADKVMDDMKKGSKSSSKSAREAKDPSPSDDEKGGLGPEPVSTAPSRGRVKKPKPSTASSASGEDPSKSSASSADEDLDFTRL